MVTLPHRLVHSILFPSEKAYGNSNAHCGKRNHHNNDHRKDIAFRGRKRLQVETLHRFRGQQSMVVGYTRVIYHRAGIDRQRHADERQPHGDQGNETLQPSSHENVHEFIDHILIHELDKETAHTRLKSFIALLGRLTVEKNRRKRPIVSGKARSTLRVSQSNIG